MGTRKPPVACCVLPKWTLVYVRCVQRAIKIFQYNGANTHRRQCTWPIIFLKWTTKSKKKKIKKIEICIPLLLLSIQMTWMIFIQQTTSATAFSSDVSIKHFKMPLKCISDENTISKTHISLQKDLRNSCWRTVYHIKRILLSVFIFENAKYQ